MTGKQPLIGDSSDRSWESHGRSQAYYGVLSTDRFRTENLNDAAIAEFMASGAAHVAEILATAERNFGVVARGHALDFGCGVGRLLLPLAREFAQATGVDISPGMLEETRRNAERAGLSNIALVNSVEHIPADAAFDFIHSVIVFQHIPTARGEAIIAALLQRLAPGGVAALHLHRSERRAWWRRLGSRLRRHLTLLNIPANLLNRRPWNEPMMQMNAYSLDRIFDLAGALGFRRMMAVPAGDARTSQVFVLFRKD